ncbi:asparaginase [Aminobacter aganoensis]|uniref:L-asparaginase II n=1 Tax=Aminobacter aganoensis TaxID=83264 RepID=A0A7X0F5D2_9HYPH|nr:MULTISPECIES: asparaginase [Aminobacter]KQU66905.1 asparaginase [Aminobacter sp. DSM 101952]MBB6353437.1 L-asparaginase II [Aminobacter aganoensis]
MTNPVLVEVLRGDLVESAHRGAVIVVDGDGKTVFAAGDADQPVFPRSAVKAIQALPFVESGAADAYGFGDRELALACASHSGEPAHAELANAMLARAGLGPDALECGAHWPSNHAATIALARSGASPSALHNNCSGKHSAFVCTCRHLGIAHLGYVRPEHRFQQMIRETMEAVTGAPHNETNRGTDGCSIPTFAVPLQNLARGFARMVTGNGLDAERAKAARRLMSACMAEPFQVAGTDRADTELMQAAPGRIFVKVGAEGVFCAAVPELGLGIALKCDDGAGRAAEAMIAAVLARLLAGDEALSSTLAKAARPVLKNWNGIEVASLRPTSAFA